MPMHNLIKQLFKPPIGKSSHGGAGLLPHTAQELPYGAALLPHSAVVLPRKVLHLPRGSVPLPYYLLQLPPKRLA